MKPLKTSKVVEELCRKCRHLAKRGKAQDAADALFEAMTGTNPTSDDWIHIRNTRNAICFEFVVG